MATEVERISRAQCSYVSCSRVEQGVVPVLDKPLNKGKSGVGWSWRPFVCRSWSMASFNPSWFPGVICKLLSIGIAVVPAGHDSFIPVIV